MMDHDGHNEHRVVLALGCQGLRIINHKDPTCPEAPPSGWWIIMRALGMEYRLPLVPAPSRKAPIDAASPKQYVCTLHRHICAPRAIQGQKPLSRLTNTDFMNAKQ